jgi:uncharacterized membrane protein YhaH (DUF805 family)
MKIFSFTGRIRRRDYWLYNWGLGILAIPFNAFTFEQTYEILLYFVLLVPYLWAYYAIGAQRCHDIGYSGWMQLIPFFQLVLAFNPGVVGENVYGKDPKEPQNFNE